MRKKVVLPILSFFLIGASFLYCEEPLLQLPANEKIICEPMPINSQKSILQNKTLEPGHPRLPFISIIQHPGWPVTIPVLPGRNWWPGPGRVVVTDLDNDKIHESVILMQGDTSLLSIVNEDGNIRTQYTVPGPIYESFSISDLDNDHQKEIILTLRKGFSDLYLVVLSANGSIKWEKDLTAFKYDNVPPIIADMNLDGKKEIIIKAAVRGSIYTLILSNTGKTLYHWIENQVENVGSSVECYPIVGNFDADNHLEFLLPIWYLDGSDHYSYMRVYNMDGTKVNGFPDLTLNEITYTPIAADINFDGFDEIIGIDFSGNIYIIDHHGEFLLRKYVLGAHGTPVIADMDNDGHFEIVFSSNDLDLYVMGLDGEIILEKKWPEVHSASRFSPVIGDIDGDHYVDIVLATIDEIIAFNRKGEMLEGFPLPIVRSEQGPSPTIADIDNDGKIEIVASTNSRPHSDECILYAWDLPTKYDEKAMMWRMYQFDEGHSGRYVENCHLLPPSDIALERELNRSLLAQEAFHTVTWADNRRNANYQITGTKIYRKLADQSDSAYTLLATLPAGAYSYEDGHLDVHLHYVYALATLGQPEGESILSLPVSHMKIPE